VEPEQAELLCLLELPDDGSAAATAQELQRLPAAGGYGVTMRRFMSWMSIRTPWQFRIGVFVASFGAFSVGMLTDHSELGLGLGVGIIVVANIGGFRRSLQQELLDRFDRFFEG